MILQTDRLQLIPYNPTLLAALLESADRFEEASGLRVAEGFRDFVTSGEVSPEWLAKAPVDRDRPAVGHKGDEGAENTHRPKSDDERLDTPDSHDEAIEESA